ncbi:glycoside hydrolase family 16 protein [Aquihabitans sp. G128]|uniref:glycoside hydrolase family 16 protein n=1 Tax=Aquihabitans sp. G128 TaxID=2849779 RepID=UPI001C23234C|nr:glycoside hydrolase family 16 protein [Aquihabitans sp. G128]QXC59753.1 glycoside hydrolase family 16 protein [Aquihabitans sp. G128]
MSETPTPTTTTDRAQPRRARRRLLAVAALPLLAAFAACEPTPTPTTPTATTTAPTTTTTAPSGGPTWRVVGGDEFSGSTLDATRWKPYHNTYGDGNAEVACLTPANVAVGGGRLRIAPKHEDATCPNAPTDHYTSGFIGSRETGTYYPLEAKYEIRAKVPHAQGIWPAFWLRHRNGASTAEVDVMEYFHSATPGATTQTLHLDGVANVAKRSTAFEAPTATPGWHTWGVEISRVDADGDGARDDVRFAFTLDAKPTFSYVDTTHRWADAAPADATFDIAVNQAVGGRWVGDPDGQLGVLPSLGRCSQGGTIPACTTTGIRRVDWADPATTTYEVDWVRVSVKR